MQSLHRQIHCLDLRPERQQECAVGSCGGAVSLWDLRFVGQPILCTANPDHGDVVEVGHLTLLCPTTAMRHCSAFEDSSYICYSLGFAEYLGSGSPGLCFT